MVNDILRAPFSKELVNKINTFQEDPKNCRYVCDKKPETCRHRYPDNPRNSEGILTAFVESLICECGDYKQTWVCEN